MSSNSPVELQIFCDASMKAYGIVSYFRQGSTTIFVIARNRVAPLKQLRNLTQTWVNGYHYCSTDIYNDFVSTRLIRSTCGVTSKLFSIGLIVTRIYNSLFQLVWQQSLQWWGYCPSADNPVDLVTRGIPLFSLQTSVLWMNGPVWIISEELMARWNPPDLLHVQLIAVKIKVLSSDPVEETSEVNKCSSGKHDWYREVQHI